MHKSPKACKGSRYLCFEKFILKLDQSVPSVLEVSVNLLVGLICIFLYSNIHVYLLKYANIQIRPTSKLTTTSGDTGRH